MTDDGYVFGGFILFLIVGLIIGGMTIQTYYSKTLNTFICEIYER